MIADTPTISPYIRSINRPHIIPVSRLTLLPLKNPWETVNINKTYKIDFYDIYEAPPKVSVKVTTSTDQYAVMGDVDQIGVVNRIDAIIETYEK